MSHIDICAWLVWGFGATVVLTTIMAASQGLGLTRMNIPYLLGTMFTDYRDRAKPIGFVVHALNGWVFSFVYVAAFHSVGHASIAFGALIGLVHASFVLAVAMPLLPGLHPRMASEQQGPSDVRVLEPPGFMALHYGLRTPVSVLVAHVIFGAILGGFYPLR